MKESSKSFQNIFLTAFVLFLLAILFLKGISILAAGNIAYINILEHTNRMV